jgi:hypothetical protein
MHGDDRDEVRIDCGVFKAVLADEFTGTLGVLSSN